MTASSALPSPVQEPITSFWLSASGPIKAIERNTLIDSGKTSLSFFNSTIERAAISRAAATFARLKMTERSRASSA